MRTILTRIFSVLLAAGTTVSAVAQVQLAKKAVGENTARAAVTQVAKAPQAGRTRAVMPQKRTLNLAKSGLRSQTTARIPGARKSAPYAAAEGLPTIAGSVIYAESWNGLESAPIGLYTVPTNDTQSFDLIFEGPEASYGGIAYDGVYYSGGYQDYGFFSLQWLDAFDMESGEKLWQNNDIDITCLQYAGCVDPTTNTVYAIIPSANICQLATIDYSVASETTPPTVTPIAELDNMFVALAATSTGELYGIWKDYDTQTGAVYASTLAKFDKTTGSYTNIGETGMLPQYITGATIDPKTDRMFWTVCPPDETGLLTEVNLSTGAATVLYQFPDGNEVAGLYIPQPAAEDGAPAAVTDLVASFPEGTMSGTVSFTAPTTLFDGSQPTIFSVSYQIRANGILVDEGVVNYGDHVSFNYTADVPGFTEFVVTASNAIGVSPKAKTKLFIGKGVPETPNVSAEYDEAAGKMTLTWPAIVGSADGGYINPAQVKYTVTRFPGEVVVAQDIAENTFSENLAIPENITSYYYTVVAKYDGIESATGTSNTVTLGNVIPPYEANFDNDLQGWTVFDANDDGKTWMYNNGAARVAYNSSLAMDDWLFSVPMKLEAGKMYKISFKTWSQSTYFKERIEVKFGRSATPAGMTETILEPTEMANGSSDPLLVEEFVVPTENGLYYVGFHGISDADAYYLFVDDFAISAPMSAECPAAVDNLTATGDPNGELKINIAFNAPTKTLSGNDLASLEKIQITREGVVVREFEAPAPGAPLSYEDVLEATGTYSYEVVAYNAEGAGKVAKISCFCGIDVPEAPESVGIVENATPGSVSVSWTAVTKDIQGNTIPAGRVKYDVYTLDGNSRTLVQADITDLSCTFDAVAAGEQDFIQAAVFAKTDNGEGEGQVSDMIPVGTPYDGIDETFENGTLSYIWGLRGIGGGSVSLLNADSGIEPVNNDGGFIGIKGQYLDSGADFFSGKVSLENLTAPGLTFYTYNIIGDDGTPDINELSVSVRTMNGEYVEVMAPKTIVEICGEEEGWAKVTIDLAAYAGQVIQFQITGITKQYVYTMIDNIKVANLLDYDLKAVKLAAPATVTAGSKYNVDVTVANDGAKEATGWSVDLMANGEKVETIEGAALAGGESTTLSVEREMSPLATESITYSAVINYAADLATDDNTFQEIIVTPKVSKLPAVTDLAAEEVAAGVKLTWTEPDLTTAPSDPVTIDFEDGESFAQEYADWTFVDADGAAVGGFQGSDIPGITPGSSTASFFIFDNSNAAFQGQYAQSFTAHSGTKYLASLFRYDDGQVSDWAISPAVVAGSTVSFYAKSYSNNYPEKIEILTSTGSTDIADFTVLQAAAVVPGDWTLYEFTMPENATRFAIHSCAASSFMLMIDDFTYTPGDKYGDVNIIGYNIYRDGEKINAEPEAECEYIDANATEGEHTYVVTVVYDKGESAASNEATISYSGLADLTAGLSISTEPGKIIVKGAEGIDVIVVATDGKVIYSAKGDATIATLPGIYVVKAGEKVVKVAVK